MDEILGVILAGGLGTRMGGIDKVLLPLGGRSILLHVKERLQPQVARVGLNANGDPDRFEGYGFPILPDNVPGFPGPLAGVLAGMDWAAEQGVGRIVTVAGDTPFFPLDLVARLGRAAERTGTPIALAATQEGGRMRRHPTFGIWDVSLRHDLRKSLASGLRKVVLWTDRHGAASAAFDDLAFFNINSPEDLTRAEGMLG